MNKPNLKEALEKLEECPENDFGEVDIDVDELPTIERIKKRMKKNCLGLGIKLDIILRKRLPTMEYLELVNTQDVNEFEDKLWEIFHQTE